MNKNIVLLDLFSGIGGFSLGLTQAGFNITTHLYSEIDKHAIAVYKYKFKNSVYAGDVTTLDGRSIPRPNIITFGSPCQDFSLAGKRTGMAGQRSSLIGEAIRLITESRPDVFIWENVKGVFSSNDGEDFWAVIQAFTNIGGYRLEWQLLNTAWFLPQNRERIYLVGHIRESSGGTVFPFISNSTKTLSPNQIGYLETKFESSSRVYDTTQAVTLNSECGGWGAKTGLYMINGKIRRLTPLECERVQGFPENWTEYGDYGIIKIISDVQRYKMLGNAVTVRVVEEIGKRLLK